MGRGLERPTKTSVRDSNAAARTIDTIDTTLFTVPNHEIDA